MTVLCLMLAVVICAGACTVGYFTYRNSIYEAYSSFAYGLAYTASSYVDGDRITGYLDTGTPDEAYDEMARHLNTIYQSTELSSIYISKPKPETMTLLNIYDVRIHEAADPAPYAIGVEDPITGDPEEVVRIYETGSCPTATSSAGRGLATTPPPSCPSKTAPGRRWPFWWPTCPCPTLSET